MARINQGFLGNASGKLGNVVFSKWRDLQTARQYQPDITDANSPSQQKQRTRMMALLKFLKPLNKTFIKFYNSPLCKESTPWAKAIKDNMKAVAPDGCIIPENISFGNPKFPPFEIIEASYDPFIDLLDLTYKTSDFAGNKNPYPYVACSVLGRYKSPEGTQEFDTRHLLKTCPNLHFFCYQYDGQREHTYENFYSDGWCWFIYVDSEDLQEYQASGITYTYPAYFKPKPTIETFNTNIIENPVPLEAISWAFEKREDIWYLIFSIDPKQISLTDLENHTIMFWGLGFSDGTYGKTDIVEWSLSDLYKEMEIGLEGMSGSMMCLYSVYKNDGEQVGRFNRFYINKGTDDIEHDYFDQLFDCAYAHPVSYVLNDNQTGFCGSIDELFGEFIQLYEQGVIYDHTPIPTVEEYGLKVVSSGNGSISVIGYTRIYKNVYYFLSGISAQITIEPDEGYTFDAWSEEDAIDLVKVSDAVYTIQMTKNRYLVASFKLITV